MTVLISFLVHVNNRPAKGMGKEMISNLLITVLTDFYRYEMHDTAFCMLFRYMRALKGKLWASRI